MLAILFAHAVATAVAPLLVYRWGRMAFYPLALVPLGSLVWVALNWPGPGRATTADVRMGARAVDEHRASIRRARRDHERAGARRSARWCCSTAPTTSITTTGTPRSGCPVSPPSWSRSPARCSAWSCSDNMLVLYVFWELTTVLSFLLVGHYAERATSRRAATQALLVTTFGGLAMLVGIVVLGNVSGTYLLSELIAAPPTGPAVIGRRGAGAHRRAVQIGDRADAFLAAGRDGRTDTGQRVPARRGDGQGRRLPRRADEPGLRRLATVAADGGDPRPAHHAVGRLARGARIRPEVDPGVRHGQPARADHADGRRGRRRFDAGRAGHAVRARDVQGVAVHGRRRHRPRHRHPRHPQAGLARAAQPTAADHRRRRDREHGRAAAVPRLRRQGGRLRNRRARPSLGAAAPYVLAGIVLGSVFTTIYSLRFLWGAFGRKGLPATQQAGRRNAPPASHFPHRARRSWPPRAWCSACGRPAWTTSSTPTPTRCPAARTTTSRCGTGSACHCCCRCWSWPSARRRSSAGPVAAATHRPPTARQRRPHLRRRAARRRPVLGAAHRVHPARVDPGHTVGDPVHAGAGSRDRARPRRP